MRNINESRLRLKQLKSWIDRFEQTPQFAQYKTLTGMSEKNREGLWAEWKEYYHKVRLTKIGRSLQKQREAFMSAMNESDPDKKKAYFDKAVQIAKWTKDNSDTVLSDAPHAPVLADPYETYHRCSDYQSRKSELMALQTFFEEMGDESKSNNPLL